MSMGTIFWILTVIICGVFLIISIKVKDQANESFSQYAIGGSSFPMILIFFTSIIIQILNPYTPTPNI